jgi:hypothetical protein
MWNYLFPRFFKIAVQRLRNSEPVRSSAASDDELKSTGTRIFVGMKWGAIACAMMISSPNHGVAGR